eukprot:706327-Rhodomonas_salina.3
MHEVYESRDFWSLTLCKTITPPLLKEHYDTVARHLHNAIREQEAETFAKLKEAYDTFEKSYNALEVPSACGGANKTA